MISSLKVTFFGLEPFRIAASHQSAEVACKSYAKYSYGTLLLVKVAEYSTLSSKRCRARKDETDSWNSSC